VSSNKSEQNHIMVNKEQSLQSKRDIEQKKKSDPVEKDGFRYDYDDSSDLK
jgi:hypothetical protein